MEKANKKIIYEATLVHNAFNEELNGYGDNMYSRYHTQNAEWYRSFSSRFNQILGFNGQTIDEFVSHVSALSLTDEQRKALTELRREPMFIKLMGEVALQQKGEIEGILETKITPDGMTFADENGLHVAVKTEEQLEQEVNSYNDKLSQLLSTGKISDEQYEKCTQNLDYIYRYYFSRSSGEQIPFRQMTNAQYENIERRAEENGISFNEQFRQETEDLQNDFEELQESQSKGFKR